MLSIITGVAGFIGSNLAEQLIRNGNKVVGLDNLGRKGSQNNLDRIQALGGDFVLRSFTSDAASITRGSMASAQNRGADDFRQSLDGNIAISSSAAAGCPRRQDNPGDWVRDSEIYVTGLRRPRLSHRIGCIRRAVAEPKRRAAALINDVFTPTSDPHFLSAAALEYTAFLKT